jgi:hypothetical protein
MLYAPEASGGEYRFFYFHVLYSFKIVCQIYGIPFKTRNLPYAFFN